MAKLQLLDLYCNDTEDSFGSDEIYLFVNGIRFPGEDKWWSMSKGEHVNLRPDSPENKTPPATFDEKALIRLYDYDDNWGDSPDLLGDHTAT